jgi:hypothetical protein
MDNYSDIKQLERHIANDVTPSRTTTDILANLKLLHEMKGIAAEETGLGSIAKEEMKYLNAAMTGLQKSRILKERFGSGLQGAMDVAALLKDRYNTKVFDEVMDSAMKGTVLGTDGAIPGFEGMNAPIG